MKALLFLFMTLYLFPNHTIPYEQKDLAVNYQFKTPTYKARVVPKKKDMVLECTAYCVESSSNTTSLGEPLRVGYTLAVDPSVIPYGSKVVFHSRKQTLTAADCGGDIVGNRADIALGSMKECFAYGRRWENVTVYYKNQTELEFYTE